jgi:hypothetical protein
MHCNYGIVRVLLLVGCLVWLGGCSPEVGSEQWCAEMKRKPTKDWTANEAADYTKYCVLKLEKK